MMKKKCWLNILSAGVAMLAACAAKAETVFPGKTWETALPESQGVDPVKLDEALTHLKSLVGSDGLSQVMVIRHGRVIWRGDYIDSWHNVFSCTKSFYSAVAGLLIEDGVLKADTPLCTFVPELKEMYPQMNVAHCLSLTAGYAAADAEYPFVPAVPLFNDGKAFHYSGDALNMMSLALSKAAGEPVSEIFKRRIAEPIGIDHAFIWGDYGQIGGVRVNNGSGSSFKGVHTTAQNMARFALLLLNRGCWNGKQLLPEKWIEKASHAQSAPDLPQYDPDAWYATIHGAYGLGFWVNAVRADGKRMWPDAPDNTYAIQGSRDNICFIVPEWDMILVRLGTDKIIDTDRYNEVFKKLASAIK